METMSFTGALLRMLRVERNWSQERLCKGICAVSYLSKIEQGRVQPNESLLRQLFEKMDVVWQTIPKEEGERLCEELYDAIFSDDTQAIEQYKENGLLRQEGFALGEWYLDYLVIRSYCCGDTGLIAEPLQPLLDDRQNCLLFLAEGNPHKAAQVYPCALSILKAGILAFQKGEYLPSLEQLLRASELASQNGYARILLTSHLCMGDICLELQDAAQMKAHYQIAMRLARAMGDSELIGRIDHNIASAAVFSGDFRTGYLHFSRLENLSAQELYLLALCCEKLGYKTEALQYIKAVENTMSDITAEMSGILRMRLEDAEYQKNAEYGKRLMDTFESILHSMPNAFARLHLPWIEEWCIANRQYRTAFEITKLFLNR